MLFLGPKFASVLCFYAFPSLLGLSFYVLGSHGRKHELDIANKMMGGVAHNGIPLHLFHTQYTVDPIQSVKGKVQKIVKSLVFY